MKKILFFLTLFSTLSCQNTHALTHNPINLAVAASSFITALWLSGKTLEDCGHRYWHCKKVALTCAQDLKKDDIEEILNEDEIKAWSIVQGISAIPAKCWREITATSITALLLYLGIQNLRGKGW